MRSSRPSARARSATEPRLDRHGLVIGDRHVPLYSGALHYWRTPRVRWRPALEAMVELGFTLVETYVPWGVHERPDGGLDFGQDDPGKDLGAFLDLAHELGLFAFIRPGPHINAELTYFGLPRRVVFDERAQARSASGQPLVLPAPPRMFPVPSYASRFFREQLDRWLRAVGEIVAPRLWPKGPVVLLQVDNEAAYYFRDSTYDADYHPDALADFARFLERRYQGEVAALNQAWGSDHADFASAPAPRALPEERLQPQLDWVAFQEALLVDALADMKRQMIAAGLGGVPFVHNLPMGDLGLPTSLSALGARLDLVGLDYYHQQPGLEAVRKRTSRLAGSTRLPFAPELGAGAPPWFVPRSDADSLITTLAACAHGLRGFNLYMAVERDRWYGAPLDAAGEPRPSATSWRALLHALRERELWRLERKVEVALSIPREYVELTRATHSLAGLSPTAFDLSGMPTSSACVRDHFGFAQPTQLAWEPLLGHLDAALCDEQVPFVYVDGDADLSALPDLRLVIAPTFEHADRARMAQLDRFVARGGTVVMGPHVPHLDEQLRPHAFGVPGGRPRLLVEHANDAQTLIRALVDELSLSRSWPVTPRTASACVWLDGDRASVVFVVHPTPAEGRVQLRLPEPLALVDALSGERFAGTTAVELPMAAHGCRMLLVERPS